MPILAPASVRLVLMMLLTTSICCSPATSIATRLIPAQGMFGKVMLRLIFILSPRLESTYRWSTVVGVRYARSSEITSRAITLRLTSDTTAPEPVRSLKSSKVFG